MKLTIAQLRRLIREAVKAHIEDEASFPPGRWEADGPLSPEKAGKLGPGVWPGGVLDEEELDEEEET